MVIGGIRASEGRDNLVFSAAAAIQKGDELLYVFGGRSSPFHPSSALRVAHLRNGGTREIQSTGKDMHLGSLVGLTWTWAIPPSACSFLG